MCENLLFDYIMHGLSDDTGKIISNLKHEYMKITDSFKDRIKNIDI